MMLIELKYSKLIVRNDLNSKQRSLDKMLKYPEKKKYSFLLVKLVPKDMRSQDSINLGYELIKDVVFNTGEWEVTECNYWDKIDPAKYNIIGFNLFYVIQMFNLIPFLRKNNIEPLSDKRKKKPLLIAGGQGIHNFHPIKEFLDFIVLGDGEQVLLNILEMYKRNKYFELNGLIIPNQYELKIFAEVKEIVSPPVIFKKRAIIEITRGCRYRCTFCEYAFTNKKYRQKDLELIKEQILYVKGKGIKNINLMSANFGNHTELQMILNFCVKENIKIMNTDVRIDDYVNQNLHYTFDKLKIRTLKVGLESFDQATRFKLRKKITDEQFETFVDRALEHNVSNLHFYLIYGIPNDNYDKWFEGIAWLKQKIDKVKRNIRLEFSITNFEPAPYTSMQDNPIVDFSNKEEFLKKYLKCLEENEIIKDASKMSYSNMSGRLGRKEDPYMLTIYLLQSQEPLTELFLYMGDYGASRSLRPNFLKKIAKFNKNIFTNSHPEFPMEN